MRLRFFVVLLTLVLMPSLSKAQTANPTKPSTLSKEELAALKEKNAKTIRMNALIFQANQATQTRDWPHLEDLTEKLIAEDPGHWQFYRGLGRAQINLGKYDEAITTYDKALDMLSKETDSPAQPDSAKARAAAMGDMLANQGNAYLKLKKNDEAMRAYTKAAALDPNPGRAYFNLCATQYNLGKMDGALIACDKAITADPKKADAYFIKGSVMFAETTPSKDGGFHAPPGTVEALKEYLELAPEGGHASDVKQMLDLLGEKVSSTDKAK